MVYDSEIYHRQSNRLKGYDYTQNGLYYITICTRDRQNLLSKIENNGGAGLHCLWAPSLAHSNPGA